MLGVGSNLLYAGGMSVLVANADGVPSTVEGFEERFISSMTKTDNNCVILVGGDRPQNHGKIMFLINGKKVPAEVTIPGKLLTSISADSPAHGWICGWAGTLIEYRLVSPSAR